MSFLDIWVSFEFVENIQFDEPRHVEPNSLVFWGIDGDQQLWQLVRPP